MMTSERESLDRAVEEARAGVFPIGVGWDSELGEAIEKYAAAVSAKARAEERERHREGLERLKSALLAQIGSHVRSPFEPARSSEEAGNGSA